MASFLKYTLATILGILISTFILFALFFVIIAALASGSTGHKGNIKPKTILHLELNKPIPERTVNNPFENFDFQSMEPNQEIGLYDIVNAIEHAKTDNNISGILLDLNFIPAKYATVDEIREALLDFKESGKFIVSYSDYLSLNAYFLASVADQIYLNPQGIIFFNGLYAEYTFFKNALEKIGVEFQIFRGKDNIYKSAVEPFLAEKMSEESKLQTSVYLDKMWAYILNKIARERVIGVDELNKIADNFRIMPSSRLQEYNLIDGFKYKDEILEELKMLLNISSDKKLNAIKLRDYHHQIHKTKILTGDKIALIYASGEIVMGEGTDEVVGAERISREIRKVRQDSTIKAIVIRINSGGGSAFASDIIWREIYLAKQTMPVIVSAGAVAASGAYYIAAPADMIIANPLCLTGSIGVFAMIPNTEKLLNDKLGLRFDGVKTNKLSDIFTMTRGLNDTEEALINESVQHTYKTFLSRVAEGRGMTTEQADELARGRVWSAFDAIENGLIDTTGTLHDALQLAMERAGLSSLSVIELPKQKEPFEQFMENFGAETMNKLIRNQLPEEYQFIHDVYSSITKDYIYTRLPFEISIK